MYVTCSIILMVEKTLDGSMVAQVVILYIAMSAYLIILVLIVILLVISYRKRCGRNKIAVDSTLNHQ